MSTIIIALIVAALATFSGLSYKKLKASHKKLKAKEDEIEEMKNREKKLLEKAQDLNNRSLEQLKTIASMENLIETQDKILHHYRKDWREK